MKFKPILQFLAAGLLATAASAQTAPAVSAADVLQLDLSNGGTVRVQLRPDKAPAAVERIKTLAGRGFYDGLTFHRVIDGFMAQGGDPAGDGTGGSELPDLKAEFNDLPHLRGTMSMARAGEPDSANSQFFIMLMPNLSLDGRYTAVGRVVDGMQYVDAIEKGEPPANPTRILRARVGQGSAAAQAASPSPAQAAPAEATPAQAAPAGLPAAEVEPAS